MGLIKKEISVEVKVGDIVKTTRGIFRDDLTLYVCHIDGDLLYISDEINTPKDDCETSFIEDCYLV
jgi:hypothetical protein